MDRWKNNIRTGMMVQTRDNQTLGTVERLHGDGFHVKGEHIRFADVDRVEGNTIFLKEAGARWANLVGGDRTMDRTVNDQGSIRVPVAEERLNVEKRTAQLGEVQVQKHVREENVNIPVELTREEVRVERVDVADRPLRPGDMDNAFQEGTIRVPVRGEEAVVNKEAVVTGEVVINKERTTERQTVSDTVRKEFVDVDEAYNRNRDNFRQHFEQNRARAVGGRTREFTEAESNYRYGVEAAHDQRFRGRNWNEIEPDLRRDWETRRTTTGTTTTTGTATAGRTTTGSTNDGWEVLREEVREGFDRMRR
jgi:uncharacterized protein (TIGR02271 family)